MSEHPPPRNEDRCPGDDGDEMLRRDGLDADTADAVLDGRASRRRDGDLGEVSVFLATLRSAATESPTRPNHDLAKVLANGLPAAQQAPTAAAAASRGQDTTVSPRPTRQRRTALRLLTVKVATLSLAAKAAIAGAAVVATTAGAGAVGALPEPLQGPFDRTVGSFGLTPPSSEGDSVEVPDEQDGTGEQAPQQPPGDADSTEDTTRSPATGPAETDVPDLPGPTTTPGRPDTTPTPEPPNTVPTPAPTPPDTAPTPEPPDTDPAPEPPDTAARPDAADPVPTPDPPTTDAGSAPVEEQTDDTTKRRAATTGGGEDAPAGASPGGP